MVYQGATGLYHFLINVIPFISNSVWFPIGGKTEEPFYYRMCIRL